ncbi:MAG: methyltransferase domain-containing protein, partial [Ilumatobacteraceae bacterium]
LGVTNVEFATGDAYALDFPDGNFDVVHAHQTLQHLADPVRALREMCRVAKPGGVVAARDADYGGMTWFPLLPGLSRWMDLYQAVHRSNGGEPDAGRHLRSWALQAGFGDVACTASMWSYGSDEERRWWGGMWADRVTQSSFAAQAVALGVIDQTGLDALAATWRDWSMASDGWFGIPSTEILFRKPSEQHPLR